MKTRTHRLFRDTKPPSRLESRFELLWRALGGPAFEKEFWFHPVRKWRADFAHLPSRTLIEIEGGIYVHGRHNHSLAPGPNFGAPLRGWEDPRTGTLTGIDFLFIFNWLQTCANDCLSSKIPGNQVIFDHQSADSCRNLPDLASGDHAQVPAISGQPYRRNARSRNGRGRDVYGYRRPHQPRAAPITVETFS